VAGDGSGQLLELTVRYLSTEVCVVVVKGELDMLTAPLLHRCICQQLVTAPAHLVIDLELVGFLGCSGLNSLLEARAFAQQNLVTQLHLTGLATRFVARVLRITGLLGLFDTYPTLADALAVLDEPSAGS
jgi:anti-sigma B factor antagonist